MYYKTAGNLCLAMALCAMALLFFAQHFFDAAPGSGSDTFVIAALIASVILLTCALVISLLYYRCPNCRVLLWTRGSLGNYCKHCGYRFH